MKQPIAGLARTIYAPSGTVHLSPEQLTAIDTQPVDERAKFRAELCAYIGDRWEQADIMARQLKSLGYDVSAYTGNGV